MHPSQPALSVEEFHGPYGPYQVSELVLQKIWLERAFDLSRLRDRDGRLVEVEHPGTWNRLEGPDFRNAVLRIDGLERRGDVEVHFSEADWRAHQHDRDPAYDRVILHVLYHAPPGASAGCRTSRGTALATVSLLPLLLCSLEEYAGDDSLIASTGVDLRPEVESLLAFGVAERRRRLAEQAQRRWQMKCYYAALRIARLGWQGACHQSALEVMGFSRNRLPMLMLAERYSLQDFAQRELDPETDLMEGAPGRWRLSGCRPANHPVLRLRQYAGLVRERPDWPVALEGWGDGLRGPDPDFAEAGWGSSGLRAQFGLPGLRSALLAEVLANAVGGAKADTLICDALLPLLASRSGEDFFALWFHWNAGNGPASCAEALRCLQVLAPRRYPASNGWLQGILGMRSGTLLAGPAAGRFQAHA